MMLLGGASSAAFSFPGGSFRSSGREFRTARLACPGSRTAALLRAAGLSVTPRTVHQPDDGRSRQQRSLVPFLTSAGALLLFGHGIRSTRRRSVLQAASSASSLAKKPNPRAKCRTTLGDFTVEILLNKAPITASNFIDLAQRGYYDGIFFHRAVAGVLLQFGCPNAREPFSPRAGYGLPLADTRFDVLDGSGRSCRRIGGNIPDEFDERLSNEPGTLSMVNAGAPDTGGSQFFINVGDNSYLDWFDDRSESRNPVFAKILDGFTTISKISRVPGDKRGAPTDPVQMIDILVDLRPKDA